MRTARRSSVLHSHERMVKRCLARKKEKWEWDGAWVGEEVVNLEFSRHRAIVSRAS